MTDAELSKLAARVRDAYYRCSFRPEIGKDQSGNWVVRGDAFIALLELRNMALDVETALLSKKSSNNEDDIN